MLCSHLNTTPSCRRFPPQTRGEHLWCRTTRDASGDSWGGCFHDRCRCRCCAAPHHMQRGISFFILPLSLKVLQPRDVGRTSGTPRDTLSLQPTASSGSATSPFPPAQEHWEQRLAPRKPSCLQMQSCAVSSYKQSNLGRVYNYSYFFFLYYPNSKNLTSVLDVHPPPHYLSIMYFLSLHLLFEKTLSKVFSLKKKIN